jgi:hypothetical protein
MIAAAAEFVGVHHRLRVIAAAALLPPARSPRLSSLTSNPSCRSGC